MRTAVAETSRAAFHSLSVKDYLQPKEREVMAVFDRTPSGRYTRQQLSTLTGMPLHCICGRVRSLLDKNRLVVHGETTDPATRKPQELLGLPIVGQGVLF
ncbi:MAG: hypothetical protein JHC40_20810 [Burkholderiales bacterium]|nr:hypothetical protein [Burkholderiales bacterium]